MFKHITRWPCTWGRQLYYRQQLCNLKQQELCLRHVRVHLYCSESNCKVEPQVKLRGKPESTIQNHVGKSDHLKTTGHKLYKERRLTDAEMEEERLYQEGTGINSNESDMFGTGRLRFTEESNGKGVRKKKGKTAVTALPERWSETFGTLDPDEGKSMSKESISSTLGSHNERYMEDVKNDGTEPKFYRHIRLARYNRKHIPNWYARKIQKFGKRGQIREAIEVFDNWMIERDRVKPTMFEFGVLMKLLGHAGYTKKAFQLHKLMLEMGIYTNEHIYTSLFNACSNSPWPDDGLTRARKLHTQMLLKGHQPKYITYQAMIKAFGICGDINTAFSLADEAAQIYGATDNLLNSLLIACITDKEAGFRHAILVWRRFRKMGIKPNLSSYNLLMRAVNECGIGSPKLVGQLLSSGTSNNYLGATDDKTYSGTKQNAVHVSGGLKGVGHGASIVSTRLQGRQLESFKQIDRVVSKFITDNDVEEHVSDKSAPEYDTTENDVNHSLDELGSGHDDALAPTSDADNLEWWQMDIMPKSRETTVSRKLETQMNKRAVEDTVAVSFPDILDPNEQFTGITSVDQIQTREERFGLLGGLDRFLGSLDKQRIVPNIVMFTQLMMVVPQQEERNLLWEMSVRDVIPDIDFFNHLMHKRCLRRDYSSAQEVLDMINGYDLTPNIRTYGIQALTCRKRDQGLKLIKDMTDADLAPNAVIMGSLIYASHMNFPYKRDLLVQMSQLGIKPNVALIRKVEEQISMARRILVSKDRGEATSDFYKAESFERSFETFVDFYNNWTKENIMAEEHHPWKPFRQNVERNKRVNEQN